jgi:hypothetical protein
MSILKTIAFKILNGELPSEAETDVVNERVKVCESCPHLTKLTKQCSKCWCFVELKTQDLSANCPIGKW